MKKIIFLLFNFGLLCSANATSITQNPKLTTESQVSSSLCKLNREVIPTVNILDTCWNTRENISNQEIITQYLEANPPMLNDYEINWRIARLTSFIGNYGYQYKTYTTSTRGVNLFSYGLKAAQVAMNMHQDKVEGTFWYAVNLGSFDVAKGGSAGFNNRKEWLNAVAQAYNIDSSYNYYGSSRMLSVYYQVLPGIFGGSNKKALWYLEEATNKAPQFKLNWINFGQYYLNVKDYSNAFTYCSKGLKMLGIDGKYENLKYNHDAEICINQAKAKMGSI